MSDKITALSPARKKRLHIQGYHLYSDKELNGYKYGIRFAYALCTTMVAVGLVLNNLPLLIIAAVVAFGGTVLPYHPFDYLYNYGVRHLFKKSRIPRRTSQAKFACAIAFVWLTFIISFLYFGNFMMAYTLGGILLFLATLASAMDICVPSMIYNFFFKKAVRFSDSLPAEI